MEHVATEGIMDVGISDKKLVQKIKKQSGKIFNIHYSKAPKDGKVSKINAFKTRFIKHENLLKLLGDLWATNMPVGEELIFKYYKAKVPKKNSQTLKGQETTAGVWKSENFHVMLTEEEKNKTIN